VRLDGECVDEVVGGVEEGWNGMALALEELVGL